MINTTMKRIEETVEAADKMDPGRREELKALLETLKDEMADLAENHSEEAQSLAGFTDLTTQQAVREHPDAKLVSISSEGMAASVEKFEVSNPRLVSVVNDVCNFFASLGI